MFLPSLYLLWCLFWALNGNKSGITGCRQLDGFQTQLIPFFCRQPLLLSALLVLCLCFKIILLYFLPILCVWRITHCRLNLSMFRYTAALLCLRILIDSCCVFCPVPLLFFVTPSSCLAPHCFNQFLSSDLCVCLYFFTLSFSSLSLCLLFLSRSILLHSSSISA